ncbi:MAG: energy transducer TonB [Bacteroidia bacterium]
METFSKSGHRRYAVMLTTGFHLILFFIFTSFVLRSYKKELPEGTEPKRFSSPVFDFSYEPATASVSSPSKQTSVASGDHFITEKASAEYLSGDTGTDENKEEIKAALQKLKMIRGTGSPEESVTGEIGSDHPATEIGGFPLLSEIMPGARELVSKPERLMDSEEEGIVVVSIVVNEDGNVVEATPGQRGSTTQSAMLYRRAKDAALLAKFTPDHRVKEQNGMYTFVFTLE